MRVRPFDPAKDYLMLCEWWKAQGWGVIPLDYLSPNGLIAEVAEAPTAAGFVYRTDSSIAVLEYIVTDPKLSSSMRSAGLDQVITAATQLVKGMGFKAFFMACGDKGLAKRMEKHEFNVIGSDVVNLLRRFS